MRITAEHRAATEARVRAAIDRLLRGDLPSGGKCDVKTLAAEAGITRSALYTTYQPLKDEFEQRRQRQRDTGATTDPRDAHIERLKQQAERLATRLADALRDAQDLTESRPAPSAKSPLSTRNWNGSAANSPLHHRSVSRVPALRRSSGPADPWPPTTSCCDAWSAPWPHQSRGHLLASFATNRCIPGSKIS